MVRIESAKGLARLGIQNFRALSLGLRDNDPQVRQAAANAIINTYSCDEIVHYYTTKLKQVPSLLCGLKDTLSAGGLSPNIKTFMK